MKSNPPPKDGPWDIMGEIPPIILLIDYMYGKPGHYVSKYGK
ncbi:hypothetical protein [Paenibacillus sp. GCM10028914]